MTAGDRRQLAARIVPCPPRVRSGVAQVHTRVADKGPFDQCAIDLLDDVVPISCRRRSLGANGGSSGSNDPPSRPHSSPFALPTEPQREVQT